MVGLMGVSLMAADRMDLPPLERRFGSGFVLTVKTLDGWKTPLARGTLADARGGVKWERELPHHHGPRRVLVTQSGQVLLVDEWINVLSRYALTLIAPSGVTVAQYSGEHLISALGVPRAAIRLHARLGAWMTVEPKVVGDSVLFEAGDRRLVLRLADGQLSARD